jgi:translation initiation factor 2 alpha subunit (eIF-2alpha)
MNDTTRIRKSQNRIAKVLQVLSAERRDVEAAAQDVYDEDVPEAMLTWEVRPTLLHALHARLGTALEELDELLTTLDAAATLSLEDVEQQWRRLDAHSEKGQ